MVTIICREFTEVWLLLFTLTPLLFTLQSKTPQKKTKERKAEYDSWQWTGPVPPKTQEQIKTQTYIHVAQEA